MIADQQEIYSVLREYNPWWSGTNDPGLPSWRRVAYEELRQWLVAPPSPRAVLISGARQVGKTTLLRQIVHDLVTQERVDPAQIFYATFDHPLLKVIGLAGVLKVWEELHAKDANGRVFLLLDEIQNTSNWQTWVKHQVDFNKNRRIAVTGSAMPIGAENPESGVGRWHTIKLPTLSFYEYLKLKEIHTPNIADVRSLAETMSWTDKQRVQESESARPLIPHFHEYLLRGGFPEPAKVEDIRIAQKLLRDDIVEKVLKRDMTSLYGVRHVLDLEKVFIYLCLHDGGILDVSKMSSNLDDMSRPKINSFLSLLESAHLVYRLHPYGYGTQVLKGKPKVYLADAALAGSVMLRGKSVLENAQLLGNAVETAFFKHLFTRLYSTAVKFSYWRDTRTHDEVDIVAEVGDRLVPFEVKYQQNIQGSHLKGIRQFCADKSIAQAYVITKDLKDFRVVTDSGDTKYLQIPAVLACYWLSKSELGE